MNYMRADYYPMTAIKYTFSAPEDKEDFARLILELKIMESNGSSLIGINNSSILEIKVWSDEKFSLILKDNNEEVLGRIKASGCVVRTKEDINVLIAEYLNYRYYEDNFDCILIDTGYQDALKEEKQRYELVIDELKKGSREQNITKNNNLY